jgi:hypothetical protein
MSTRTAIRLKPTPHSIDFTLDVLASTAHVPGAVVECGTYQGHGLVTMASYLDSISDPRKVIGFDSFDGRKPLKR